LSSNDDLYFSEDINEITQIVKRKFYILDVNFPTEYGRTTVSLTILPFEEEKLEEYFRDVEEVLAEKGYIAFLRKPEEYEPNYLLIVAPFSPPSERAKIWSLASLIATSSTVFLAGYWMATSPDFSQVYGVINPWIIALSFTISLLGIIGLHELGHLIASKVHGVKADLPIFIPAFPPFGTFGAVIRQRSPPVDRKSLFDLGIAGPLISFLISVIVSTIGLTLSKAGEAGVPIPSPLLFGILVELLNRGGLLKLDVPPGMDVFIVLHPVAFAGWLGMLITAINLFPIGQLDGGHVARAIFDSKKHQYISYTAVVILLLLGKFYYFFAILALFFAMAGHPGPLNDVSKLDRKRRVLGVLLLLGIIVLCLPLPI